MKDREIKEHTLGLIIWRGALLIFFGLFILIWPISTLLAVLFFAGIYILIAGILEMISGITDIISGWSAIAEIILGLFGILLGIFILKYPAGSVIIYTIFFGIWFLVHGLYEVVSPQSKVIGSRGYAMIVGIFTIIIGVMLVATPIISGVILYWALGLYSIITGPLLVAFGLSLKLKK